MNKTIKYHIGPEGTEIFLEVTYIDDKVEHAFFDHSDEDAYLGPLALRDLYEALKETLEDKSKPKISLPTGIRGIQKAPNDGRFTINNTYESPYDAPQ